MENIVCDAMKAGEHKRVEKDEEEEQSWAKQSSCAAASAAAGVFECVSHYQNAA